MEGITRRRNLNRKNSDADNFTQNNGDSGSGKDRRNSEEAEDSGPIVPYSPDLTLLEELFLLGLKDSAGHLSFWNDSISFVLRGCLLIELILRNKLQFVKTQQNLNLPAPNRRIELINTEITGEFLLDETIGLMKRSEPLSLTNWIAYLNGETWNFSKLNYQLKQVRERIAKGLVEKGILRNDMKSYFLFEVSAYPMRDTQPKKDLVKKLSTLLTQTPEKCLLALNHESPNQTPYLRLRTLLLAICATCAEVLDNIFDDYWADQAINTGENLLDQMSIYPLPKQCTKWLGINQAVHMHYAPQLEMISTVLSILKSS